jgi:hypothetical protein
MAERDIQKAAARKKLGDAQQALGVGDVHSAKVHLAAADKIARAGASSLRNKANNPSNPLSERQKDAKAANDLINLRTKLQETTTVADFPVIPTVTMPPLQGVGIGPAPQPGCRPSPTLDRGGYSNAGGLVQAPPGAGMYMRVPFQSQAALNLNEPVAAVLNGGQRNILMLTPQLSWLQFRLRGVVIERMSNAAAATDVINFEDLRLQGGPNLIIGEGQIGVDTVRMGDSYLLGLRYNPICTSPNQLELRIRGFGANAGAALANTAGNTTIIASAVIETIVDTTYGRLNNWTQRLNQGHFTGAQQGPDGDGSNYVFMRGAPISGTVQRVPMRIQAADAINPADAIGFNFPGGGALNTLVLQSEQISWAQLQIVGLELGEPVKAVATDCLYFEDLTVGGGASLFPQAGPVPAINYLNNNVDRGGGVAQNIGLRHYPFLSATNTATLTVSTRNPVLGAAGNAGNIDVPYVNLLVDRLSDDVYGIGPRGAYGRAAGPLVPGACPTGIAPWKG